MEERDPLDRAFDVLGDPLRRRVLRLLADAGRRVPEEAVVTSFVDEGRDRRRVVTELYHNHLPKLEAAGYVEWEPGEELRRGPRFGEIAVVVELLTGHEDRLPGQWD